MKNIVPTALLGVIGLTGLGLLGLQTVDSGPVTSDAAIGKRDEDSLELVLVDDDDDGDTNRDTRSRQSRIR